MTGNRRLVIVCLVVAGVSFANWLAFAAFEMSIGGSAAGTIPSRDRFFVTSHGVETPVDRTTWVLSLFYTTATMIVSAVGFPCCGFLVLRHVWLKQVEPQQDARKKGKMGAAFRLFLKVAVALCILWATGMLYAVIRDFVVSLRAYSAL